MAVLVLLKYLFTYWTLALGKNLTNQKHMAIFSGLCSINVISISKCRSSFGRESETPHSVFQTTEMWGRKCEGHTQTGSQFWWQRDQKNSQILYNMGQKSKILRNTTMVHAKYLETLSLAIFIGDFYMPLIMCHLTELQ